MEEKAILNLAENKYNEEKSVTLKDVLKIICKSLNEKGVAILQVDKDGQCSFKTSRLHQEYLLALC